MKGEDESISDDEWLLRRIHRDRVRLNKSPLISPNAFLPRDSKSEFPDNDGISLFRESCLESPQDILRGLSAEKAAAQVIVRIPVALLKDQLKLSIKPSKTDIPGHVVISEMCTSTYESDPTSLDKYTMPLAKVASENVVKNTKI